MISEHEFIMQPHPSEAEPASECLTGANNNARIVNLGEESFYDVYRRSGALLGEVPPPKKT